MSEPACVTVVTTIDSPAAADTLASAAISGRVAASAQVEGPVLTSRWRSGAVEQGQEWRVTFITAADRVAALLDQLRTGHATPAPAITATPVTDGDPAHLAWVHTATRPE